MLDYLTKFNALPQYLKDKMSETSVLASIKELEEKYDISLAAVVMKIMVKDISILDLAQYFVFEYKLDGRKSEQLVGEMKERVLFVAADYLGFETKRKKDLIGIDKKPGQVVNKVKTSNFFFSSEDEEEVSQLTKKLGPKDNVKEINDERVNSMVDEVVFETGVSFSYGDLSERFIKVLKTYARGVRNRLDTKITLSKDADKGGLGMSEGRVDEILKSLDKRNKKREAELPEIKLKDDSMEGDFKSKKEVNRNDIDNFREKMSKVNGETHGDADYNLSSMPKKPEGKVHPQGMINAEGREIGLGQKKSTHDVLQLNTNTDKKPDLSKIKLKVDSKGLSIPVPRSKDGEVIKSMDIKTPLKAPVKVENKKLDDHIAGKDGKFKPRIVVPEGGKKKVEDVKVIPRLTGPIDELRNMNIIDFRRLDPDPMRAAAKIKEKISLLEEDGYKRKLAGIKAWRESKINMEYIEIGRKSIGQKKPINDIIHDKNISGHDTLREDEFESILNLNREIRF